MSQQQTLQIFKAGLLVGLLGLVAYVDLATGFEVSVVPLYTLPNDLATVYFGRWAGIAMAAGCAWDWADVASRYVYSHPRILYFNAATRLVFFLFVALSISHMAGTLRRARRQLRAFSGKLPECTSCHKVRDHDGYWWDFVGYLREYADMAPQSKLRPDCAHEAYSAGGDPAAPIPR